MVTTTPRRMSREDRREALLDAAVRVLHHRALAELSFELVADEAGVSKSLPYSYFDSTAEIAIELFDRVIGRIEADTDALMRAPHSFDEKLRAALGLWCDAIEDDGLLVQTLLDGKAVAAIRPLIERRDARSVDLWRAAIIDEFGLDQGDAAFVATALTAAATAALQQWVEERLERDEMLDRFVRATRAMADAFVASPTASD